MPVNLKLIPPVAQKPKLPIGRRWLKGLTGLLVIGSGWAYFTGLSFHSSVFWIFSAGLPLTVWLVAIWLRIMVYLPVLIQAQAWDRRREELLLREIRRGRRALQILHCAFITPHSEHQPTGSSSVNMLKQNKPLLHMQPSWHGIERFRHSRLPLEPGMKRDDLVKQIFDKLMAGIARHLNQLPDHQPIALLFETNTSLSRQRLHTLWCNAWQQRDIRQPVEPVTGYGLNVIDSWLDSRIHEETVLLIIALQVAPDDPDGTGEAAVALLLGNRMTQNILPPLAWVHRPEASFADTLAESIAQALDWVPVQPEDVHDLWSSGLSHQQQSTIAALNAHPPLQGIEMNSRLYNLDRTLGETGCVAPWLAIAAAAQGTKESQLIMSGETGSTKMWSVVVSPCQTVKEKV